EEAPLWIRANPRRGISGDLPEMLREDGVVLEPHPEVPGFYRVVSGAGDALRSQSFAGGLFACQDPVAYWVVALLDWHPDMTLFDACAAPGGKSALALELAAARGESLDTVRIVCGDLSASRLRRIDDARGRLGHTELLPVCMDVSHPPFHSPPGDRGGEA